jgi:predicted transcriptional regulator
MVKTSNGSVLLISIHPFYASQILLKRKLVEFRRKRPERELEYLVIYSTSPVKAVVGYAEVTGIDQGTPEELWNRYYNVGGIDKKSLMGYFHPLDQGYAIKLGKVFSLNTPRPLESILDNSVPPRCFQYLSHDVIGRLQWLP